MMDRQQPSNARRPNAASEIIINGRVWNAVWYLAWPTAVNTLIQTAYNIINRMFVGRLPDATPSLAAVGIGGAGLMVQFALTIGLAVGASALVARFLGAQQYDDADETARQSLILSVIGGALTALPFVFASHYLVTIIGAKREVIPLAASYTTIIAYSSIPMFLYTTATALLRSAGDVRSPLYAGAAVIAINILFDWLLIFGIGPFPMLGVRGAAIATCISEVAGMLIMLSFLRRSVLGECMSGFVPRPMWFARIMKIGWPAMVQNVLWTSAAVVFIRILAMLPGKEATLAQAGYTVAITIESLAFMPGVAFAMAATPLVGQNLGAGRPDRAEHSAWVATGQSVAVMTAVAIMFFVIPGILARMFTKEIALIPIIVAYLRINAISEPFLAVNMVLRGALQGAGETRVPAWITFFTSYVIRLPLAWALAVPLGLGSTGAWIGMATSTIISGIWVAGWFKWGKWRDTQV
ncbi:MAG: MATE family efflux transporter [Armatimonadota bacterium]